MLRQRDIYCLMMALVIGIVATIIPTCARLASNILQYQWSDVLNIIDGKCHHPAVNSYIVSSAPLMIYFENFLTARERRKLLEHALPLYGRSLVGTSDESSEWAGRTSSTAFLDADHQVATCITQRASKIQGFIPTQNIESLQATRYFKGQQYVSHYDWSAYGEDDSDNDSDRFSTFFGILSANCTQCGTRFPLLRRQFEGIDTDKWCQFVDCNADELIFKAIEGNALFWSNVDEKGEGDYRMLHAGMPPEDGHKVGLNIWSRYSKVPGGHTD